MSGFAVYRGLPVLVTGATGFKGAWLSWWLHRLGAKVSAIGLPSATTPSLFEQLALADAIDYRDADLRDAAAMRQVVERARPRVVFHLAAQALVRVAYEQPVETFATNVLGTIHLLEAVRACKQPCAIVVVTSDKCYENHESGRAYREEDALGGGDPYSASKGATEIAAASWRHSFFPPARLAEHGVALATARAGNVIGPGDWARDRIVPDAIASLRAGRPVPVRNPGSVRPWQHVLEPLAGYLRLGERLLGPAAPAHAEAWNFGPHADDAVPVRALVQTIVEGWGSGSWEHVGRASDPPEAGLLRLDPSKALARLDWRPAWRFREAVLRTVAGYRALEGASVERAREIVEREIAEYSAPATVRMAVQA